MIATAPQQMICFPPAALNGGKLDTAPPKVGEWVWQPKVDDWRGVIHTPTGTVWNQYGQRSSITDKFTVALDRLKTTSFAAEWLDIGMMEQRNAMMRGSIVVFDLISLSRTFTERRAHLQAMFDVMPLATILVGRPDLAHDCVYLTAQVEGEAAGRSIYNSLQLQNEALNRKFYEGVVAKRADSLYTFGRRPKQVTPDWIKHRFDQ